VVVARERADGRAIATVKARFNVDRAVCTKLFEIEQ
jgi:hypothetical protein